MGEREAELSLNPNPQIPLLGRPGEAMNEDGDVPGFQEAEGKDEFQEKETG